MGTCPIILCICGRGVNFAPIYLAIGGLLCPCLENDTARVVFANVFEAKLKLRFLKWSVTKIQLIWRNSYLPKLTTLRDENWPWFESEQFSVYFFGTKRYLPLRLLHEWAFVLLHFSWSLKVDKGKEFRKKSDDIFPEKEALLNFSKFRLLSSSNGRLYFSFIRWIFVVLISAGMKSKSIAVKIPI